MRPYHSYTPDQAFLLPVSFLELIDEADPVHLLRSVLPRLDLERVHEAYKCERGRPPFHPEAIAGLLLYGACRGVFSSRRLAQACRDNVAFMYLMANARPDFRTVAVFRKRFQDVLEGLFVQVLELCREAGLVKLGHVSLDGTKVRANASKHKAMSYGRMALKEERLEAEIKRWFEEAERQDEAEDAEYGEDNDGYSVPADIAESVKRLAQVKLGKRRLEQEAREKAEAAGKDPEEAAVSERAQVNFTDPESRIMHTPDGFQQCYNAQVAVEAESQVIVAYEVSQAPPDVQRLRPMLERIIEFNGRAPRELTADAGYASESNFAALQEASVHAVIALRRYHRDEPPGSDPAPLRSTNRWPHRNHMRDRLYTAEGKALYKLRKQTVEPVIGQIKFARGFRQFLRRGRNAVQAEWALVCTATNLLKLWKAWQPA
jgi:transposase/IS5 family transposase